MKFRTLRADEIECRVAVVKDTGISLLLYKDARCDMNILDEEVGKMNWQRSHSRENANCIVSIWDSEKGQWISKKIPEQRALQRKKRGLHRTALKELVLIGESGESFIPLRLFGFHLTNAKFPLRQVEEDILATIIFLWNP